MTDLIKFINNKIESQRDNLDLECLQLVGENINLAVPWFLMASYAYYVEDDPILTDATFDTLAKRIYKNWDDIEHQHKNLLDRYSMSAGTYLGEYPNRTIEGLKRVREIYKK